MRILLAKVFGGMGVVATLAHCGFGQIAPPPLKLTQTNGGVVLSWPTAATDFLLQTTSTPNSSNSWVNVTNSTYFAGEWETVTRNTVKDSEYFRLKGPRIFYHSQLFQLAIYYNDLLEFTFSHPLTVYGRVHANGPIYVGSPFALTFNGTVTTADTVTNRAWAGHYRPEYSGPVTYRGIPPKVIDTPVYLIPFGTNSSPMAARAALDIPPSDEMSDFQVRQMRLYNRAKVLLLISNETTTVQVRSAWTVLPGTDPFPVTLIETNSAPSFATMFPFLSLTNTLMDQRENKSVLFSQIDMALLEQWFITNSSVLKKLPPEYNAWPNVLFVADCRDMNADQLAAVRIVNGIKPPANGGTGLTLVTPNPLYVWGNYNCENPQHLATTNTTATVPCALISDALTILSSNWSDSLSSSNYTERIATDTTVNAGIVAGVVYSTGANTGQYSGGVHNLPRLLEDWSGQTLWLNGAIVNTYPSTMATNQYQDAGVYYAAPTRHFSYDLNFNRSNLQPAGTWTRYLIHPP